MTLFVASWLAACSVDVRGASDTPEPAAPESAPTVPASKPAPASSDQAPPSDTALVTGTAPRQRIEPVEPGRNAPAALLGDTRHVDHGSGRLMPEAAGPQASDDGVSAESLGLPPPPPEKAAEPTGPTPRAPAAEPEMPKAAPGAETAPAAPAAQDAAVPAAPAPQPAAAVPMETIAEAPKEAPSKPTVVPTPKTGATAVSAALAQGAAFVQLAALRSQAAADATWAEKRRAFPDLLSGLSSVVWRIDLGDRGLFFRLLTGPLPDAAAARRLCAALQARGQDCLVRAG